MKAAGRTCLCALACVAWPAGAQTAAPPVPAPPTPVTATAAAGVIPARTLVQIALGEPLSSKTSKIGDFFRIRLAAPIMLDGRVIVPAGAVGRGQVVQAAKARWGGKAGELIINARYVDCGAIHIPLGHFHFSEAGKSDVGGAFAAGMIFTPLAFVVTGGEVEVPSGAKASAQLTADVPLPTMPAPPCAPAA